MTSLIAALALTTHLTVSPTPQVPPVVSQPPIAPLSNSEKIRLATAQLKLAKAPTGIREKLTISVRQPFRADKAALTLFGVSHLSADQGPTGFAILSTSQGEGFPRVEIVLTVAHIGKPHVATFYIDTGKAHKVQVSGGSLTLLLDAAAKPQALPFAFIPTDAKCVVRLLANGVDTTFFKVDLDVLN